MKTPIQSLTLTAAALTLSLLGTSCETTGEGFQGAYDSYVETQSPKDQERLNNLTNEGRTLPSSDRLSTTVNNVGDICYDCNQADEAGTRNLASGGGSICAKFNQFKRAGVPEEPLRQALFFYENNKSQFTNQRYVSIADYTQNSRRERFYLLDLQTGQVRKEKVSHGSGSRGGVKAGDPNHDGMIDRCHHGGDISDRTNMTRAGFFSTANLYTSPSHTDMKSIGGRSVQEWPSLNKTGNNGLRMRGLSPGVNNEAMGSGVVMHGAWYNDVAATMGRSYGCPAFESDVAPSVLNTIRGGSLYYSYTPRCRELHARVERQISGWQNFCR